VVVFDNWCLDYNHAESEHAKSPALDRDSYRKKV